jgi:hypothetical protein
MRQTVMWPAQLYNIFMSRFFLYPSSLEGASSCYNVSFGMSVLAGVE